MVNLRLFSDVARCHSFSQAAAMHGITQSAASQRVSALEKKLGVTLIDRSVRPLALTEAGRVFLEGCEDVLERYDRVERKVAAMREDPEGLVRIAAIYSAGIELLNRVCESFEEKRPKIHVQVDYGQPDEIYEQVLAGDVDLGILSYPNRWKKVGIIPLREEPMGVVCNPSHPLARHDRVAAAELSGFEMVTFDEHLPVGRRLRQYLKDSAAHVTIAHSFDNLDTIKNAVSVTPRFSILPLRTVMREALAGTLTVVELTPALSRPIGIVHRKKGGVRPGESAFAPAVQIFVDHLVQQAGPGVDMITAAGLRQRRGELVGATR